MENTTRTVDDATRDLLAGLLADLAAAGAGEHVNHAMVTRVSWQLLGVSRLLARLGEHAAEALGRVDAVIDAMGSLQTRTDLREVLDGYALERD
jgi:hypothetical protein